MSVPFQYSTQPLAQTQGWPRAAGCRISRRAPPASRPRLGRTRRSRPSECGDPDPGDPDPG
eukprot:CAMPEP_0181182284 /NCGR_PEP_ID=MMETSP1096-20121128/7804_1 /TAXON_ID=156174 ORGANISM="Chrysochromulina ericina, Strain CCMP281" /NCGR_SAMPLE_ID=MMETSP1096 /ASSEMBLY_ACC=CAM_ASM_000453 /LENGTH=60 /DNA_ID=CAMNT_0023270875 /DNA_START=220 /DNA_END=399 /DNA_ORIENTATION=-